MSIIRRVPVWARLVALVAAVLVVLGLSAVSGLASPGSALLPLWVHGLLSASFAAVGSLLIVANRNDVRASWLGGVLLLIGFQAVGPFIRPQYPMMALLTGVRPDAFLPAFVWWFVGEFPSPLAGWSRRISLAIAYASTAVGAAACAVNFSIAHWPAGATGLGWRALFAASRTPGSAYWAVLFALCALAFLVLLARAIAASSADRFRTRVFAIGLAMGVLPFFLEVVLEEASPSFKALAHAPGIEPWVALMLFGPLATVPFTTAYSVVFDRIVEMRLVVRAAIQYALARSVILAGTFIPLLGLGLYFHQHRTEPLAELLTGTRPLVLIGAGIVGAGSLRSRRRLLHAIDRRFFREQYDTQLLVTNLMSDAFMSQSPPDIARGLAAEIDRTLHARADLFVIDDARAMLLDPRGTRAGLNVGAVLVGLAMADAQPMDIRGPDDRLVARLPPPEQEWLEAGRYRLVVALRSRRGEPVGFLALSEKLSGLPFSNADRRSLAALASPLALVLENERLRRVPEPPTEAPARECQSCSRLYDAAAPQCSCGGTLAEAQAPHVLRGMFRFEQRIGVGGMGIVYRATDLTLARPVAIKTLPRVTPEHVARLRHEAQAMASMVHANLAVVYGVEMWRGVPFLVEEYLAGGTLADRLRAGRLATGDALDLGITLAGVLGQLHAAGIVHCDIKPSNIGFNQNGVVKLLDFGLAHLLRDSGSMLTTTTGSGPVAQWADSVVLSEKGVLGTPPYMSPEATRACRPTPAVDLWAVAVVLFESIAGQRPFSGETADDIFDKIRASSFPPLTTLRHDCPPAIASFFDRALAPHLDARPATADGLKAELSALRTMSSLI